MDFNVSIYRFTLKIIWVDKVSLKYSLQCTRLSASIVFYLNIL